jgi:hypothetical protein
MKRSIFFVWLVACTWSSLGVMAQCDANQTGVEVVLFTDNWGYEVYWEIVPSGNGCGNGTIVSGGNALDVGCLGGGAQDAQDGNGYESNQQFVNGPICLETGNAYDIHFVDDWGDGGLSIEVYQDGVLSHLFVGDGAGDVWTFVAGDSPELSPYDSPCQPLIIEIDAEPLAISNANALASFTEPRPAVGGCQTFGYWCEETLAKTVWVSFVATSDAVLVSTCNEGTNFDTQLALWLAEDCSNYETYTLINANDDKFQGCGNANGYASELYASCLIPGETYLIQIDGYFGESGNSLLSVTSWNSGLSLDAFVDAVDCPNVKGDDSGAITLLVFGTGVNYSAVWSGPNGYQNEGSYIDNLMVGDYSVEVETACGEVASATFSVTIPSSLVVDISQDAASCQTSPDGEVTLNASGATEPYEFYWTGPAAYTATGSSQNGLVPGNYIIEITDDNGCEFTQLVNVTFDELFTFSLGEDTTICSNEEIILFGPVGLNYDWQDGSNNQFFVINGEDNGVGTYVVVLTGTNEFGCDHTDAVIVTVSNCVGIDENEQLRLSAFPSPTDGELKVSGLPQGQKLNAVVFDSSGRLVYTENLTASGEYITLGVQGLSPGIYTLTMACEGITGSSRFIVE